MLDISGLGLVGCIKIDIDVVISILISKTYRTISKLISISIFAKPGVSKDGEEGVKELRKKAHSAGVWHTVQHADPGDEELTNKPIDEQEN